ncbi:class I SAM-dependent methyltransferase [Halostella sp. JP-L12]|uniref:class I SAM-dependent methyltransferase n=1 Tax=Halostella TaxID=1843185 RepID=UPI000EF7B318|nr:MULTISPECIES: class I SAM-dependent methyltransferase [Halostella]NHN49074.1 class I SAM-dependent methyltransferase [Halostella sp. JP-L12]
MDEIGRTLDAYEADPDSYVERYRRESVAAEYGDRFFDVLPGDRILDVGCGPGADAAEFAVRGYDVTGFDLTPSFLRAGRERVPNASFARGDMRRLPFGGASFDAVWSCASFLHVPRADAPDTLREFRRVLDDHGVVFLSVKRGDRSGFDADSGRYFERYRVEGLASLIDGAGFDLIDAQSGDGWVQVLARVAPHGSDGQS